MKGLIFLLLVIIFPSFNYQKNEKIEGIYYSVDNKFEKFSIMKLFDNGTFQYSYGLSGCQGKLTGKYFIDNKRITFKNDEIFTEVYLEKQTDSLAKITPFYPDLSIVDWKIYKNAIKPISKINTGCIVEKGKHLKK
ncbi:hypothetical protein FIA58_007040 [Flavobacterium jejuense]|uniref:Uncharacterized protein n=1 Tax=Flavobacterium jejuense TaxID=1544455 RepID=A0ABX0INP5_9FLAO|nr:hypothetical protein [Flavobacterium jejuense]NHN25427.1 hypothetical protein [Flavobacterium jejuense]